MLDPSIPLAAKSPQLADPSTLLSNAMQLRDLADTQKIRQQQIAQNDLKIAEEKLALDKRTQLQKIWARVGQPKGGAVAQGPRPAAPSPQPSLADLNSASGPQMPPQAGPGPAAAPPMAGGAPDVWTVEDVLPEIQAVDPQVALDVEGKYLDHQKKIVDGAESQAKLIKANLENARALLGMARDEASYQAVRPQITQLIGAELAKALPPNFDPQAIAELQQFAFTVDEHLKAREFSLGAIKRGQAEVKGSLENLKAYTEAASSSLSVATNPQEYADELRRLRAYGVPQAILDRFPKPETWTPDTPRIVRDLGMTPEQQATAGRQAEQFNETKRHNRAMEARPVSASTAMGTSSVEDMADQLVSGNLVPSMLSKRTANYNEILTAANRLSKERTGKPYSATRLQIEYAGAARFASSLNGPQQLRFRGLGVSVVNTIDEVDALAQEMQNSGLSFANRVEMEAALKVFGNSEKGQLVARYLGAVNTLKEEFAGLVAGGYAPTEPAFALANKQINENYGMKAMQSSLHEVQRLINFRLNAFNEIAPAGVDTSNPVMGSFGTPQTPAPSGTPSPTPAPSAPQADPLGIRSASAPKAAPSAPQAAPAPVPAQAANVPAGAPAIGATVTYQGKQYWVKGYNGPNAVLSTTPPEKK